MVTTIIIDVLKIVILGMIIPMMYHFIMFLKESWKDLNEADKERKRFTKALEDVKDDINALGDAWEEFYDKQYVPLAEAIEEIGIEVNY